MISSRIFANVEPYDGGSIVILCSIVYVLQMVTVLLLEFFVFKKN